VNKKFKFFCYLIRPFAFNLTQNAKLNKKLNISTPSSMRYTLNQQKNSKLAIKFGLAFSRA
jgi:hypothetical protein